MVRELLASVDVSVFATEIQRLGLSISFEFD
jgi:hypothetical protein